MSTVFINIESNSPRDSKDIFVHKLTMFHGINFFHTFSVASRKNTMSMNILVILDAWGGLGRRQIRKSD